MKKSKFFLLALVISVVLCGCGSRKEEDNKTQKKESNSQTQTEGSGEDSSTETKVYGGSVIVGITQDLDSLDPHKAVAAGTEEVLFNIYEGLVKPDRDGNLIPAVAESYTMSEDGMIYTFSLRENIKFHDGTPVTSEDVIYSIKRCAGLLETSDPEVITVSALSCIKEVEALKKEGQKDQIQITLNEPNTELICYFTCAIVPEHIKDLGQNPIGTGPFRFVSYTPLQKFVIEKNKDYYLDRKSVV